MTPLRILDLFAGTGSATAALRHRGHDVRHVETCPERMGTPSPVIKQDVWAVANDPQKHLGDWRPDALWLSPPCQTFSMGGNTHNWHHGTIRPWWGPRLPRTRSAWDATGHIMASLHAIEVFDVPFIMENPRAGLRTMGFMGALPEPFTVTYCQYGESRMKATDLWSDLPLKDHLRPACKNGDPCHVEARRGAKTGTQGLKDDRARGRLPPLLSVALAEIYETHVPPTSK